MKRTEKTPIAANRKNVEEMPTPATNEGKNNPTKKLVTHSRKTEMPIAKPRSP